jgi:3-dehydroquinate dehydratase/shikimate dehydrogenase
LKGKLVVVIGAGGAGKALAYGAKVRGARVAVANRNYGMKTGTKVMLLISCLLLQMSRGCLPTEGGNFVITERAKALANRVGGEAIALEKLVDFRPETGMVLANSTSIGMQPNIGVSPIPKVQSLLLPDHFQRSIE